MESRGIILYGAKTKALINCAVTAQLICFFVFAFADCCFSGAVAHIKDSEIFLSSTSNATLFFLSSFKLVIYVKTFVPIIIKINRFFFYCYQI